MGRLKKFLVILLIFALTSFNFIFVASSVVMAFDGDIEGQSTVTSYEKIEFDVYFKKDGQNVHSNELNIGLENSLFVRFRVNDLGSLKDAKVKFQDANFRILKDKINSEYVKDVNEEEKEITFNKIVNSGNVEIEIPIQFEKQDLINVDYFAKENIATLSAKYVDENEREKDVNAEIVFRTSWSIDADIETNRTIDKYFSLPDGRVLLQESLDINVKDNSLPIDSESIEITAPAMDNIKPESVIVLYNGVKTENFSYDTVTGILNISRVNEKNANNEITWGSGSEEYKIIYLYTSNVADSSNLEGNGSNNAFLTDGNRVIELNSKISVKLYTKDEIVKEDVSQVEISKMGEIVSLNIENTPSIYKGYMYANVQNDTNYEQNAMIEISNAEAISNIEISSNSENYSYKVQDTEQKILNNARGNTYFKSTTINKENLRQVLGDEGVLIIRNANDEIIKEIFVTDDANENGDFVVNYEGNANNVIKITTTKPVQEGILKINHKKAIKGNTGYSKEQLKQFTELEEELKVVTNVQESKANMVVSLLDTVTDAKLSVSNSNLSTFKENENVEIIVTLNSNNEKYDLYKNPTIEIQLPEEVETIKVNSINKLYMDEFTILSAKYVSNEEEKNKIKIEFEGEQTEFKNDISQGAKIVINANITLKKDVASKTSEIKMIYTNENGNETSYEVAQPVNLNSQYGVFAYTEVKNYNNAGEIATAIGNETVDANLDMEAERRIADVEAVVVNNYDEQIEQVQIMGRIPQNDENVTFLASMIGQITTNIPDASVFYSYDEKIDVNSDAWLQEVEDFTKVRAYKIVLNNNVLGSKQVLKIPYQLVIPAGLNINQSTYTDLEVSYSYNGQEMQTNSKIVLKTPKILLSNGIDSIGNANTIDETNQGIQTNVTVTSGGETVLNGEEIYEGQTLRYHIKITNNTEETITNLKLVANHTNAIFFGNVAKEVISVEESGSIVNEYFYEEDETLTQKKLEVAELLPGDSKTLTYEFSLNRKDDLNETSGTITLTADNKEDIVIDAFTNLIKDAEFKVTISDVQAEHIKTYTSSVYAISVKIQSYLQEKQDAILEIEIPKYIEMNTENLLPDYEFLSFDNNILKLKIYGITTEEKKFIIPFNTLDLDINEKTANISFKVNLISDSGNEYSSNILEDTINQKERLIQATQKGSIDEDIVKDGDKIVYTTDFVNPVSNENNKEVEVFYLIPDAIDVKNAYIVQKNEIRYIELQENKNTIETQFEMEVGETVQLVIEAEVNLDKAIVNQEEISSIVSVLDMNAITEFYSNEVVYKIDYGDDSEQPEPEEPDIEEPEPDNPDIDKPGIDEEEGKYQISGTVWIDQNKNGLRENTEKAISSMEVRLLNAETGESVIDTDTNKPIGMTTDSNGVYMFSDLNPGRYMILFEYDNIKYRLTEYRKQGVSESMNSDVIGNGEGIAITDTITITDDDIGYIDAGFIENEKFDLSLQKTVNRITVKDSSGTKIAEYNNSELAKVEVDAKRLDGAIIIMDYNIIIKNEGELSGYVNEVIDYIPSDLEFNSEMNKDWFISTDGNLHNISLSNQIINPGEEKVITLTLLKIMNVNNTGTTINMAEIAKSSNELAIKDIDSIEGNKSQTEDDMGVAEIIVSVKTGTVIAVSFILILLLLIGTGLVIYILKRKEGKNEI